MECLIRQKQPSNKEMMSSTDIEMTPLTSQRNEQYTIIDIDEDFYTLRTNKVNRNMVYFYVCKFLIKKCIDTCIDLILVFVLYIFQKSINKEKLL